MDAIKEAQDKVEATKQWSMESVTTRTGNRDLISLDGGLGFVERVVLDRCTQACQSVTPLLQELSDVELVRKVKKSARKLVKHLSQELDSISTSKEANTLSLLSVGDNINEIGEIGSNFALSVLRLARANPENCKLQQRALRTLLKILSNAKSQRGGLYARECFSEYFDFLLDTMQAGGSQAACLQTDCCRAISHLAMDAKQRDLVMGRCIPHILAAMEAHPSDRDLQSSACSALMDIASQDLQDQILMAKLGAAHHVWKALENNPSDTSLQLVGGKLASSVAVANAMCKALERQ
jgi:hypothetical protein